MGKTEFFDMKRKFGGKYYKLYDAHPKKSDAKKDAENLRGMGKKVRVVDLGKKFGRYHYGIFVLPQAKKRKKKRRK